MKLHSIVKYCKLIAIYIQSGKMKLDMEQCLEDY